MISKGFVFKIYRECLKVSRDVNGYIYICMRVVNKFRGVVRFYLKIRERNVIVCLLGDKNIKYR